MVKVTDKFLHQGNRANVGKPFTDADDALIRELHSKRVSIKDIAEKLERTEPSIQARFERLGLKKGRK